ncbi:unnamed protein product [Coregonus sp. 'balchen']|nr:unnamed protein product [Coregonus sp. 'balchen']
MGEGERDKKQRERGRAVAGEEEKYSIREEEKKGDNHREPVEKNVSSDTKAWTRTRDAQALFLDPGRVTLPLSLLSTEVCLLCPAHWPHCVNMWQGGLREGSARARDDEGQTALHYASACEFADIVELLLQAGADPSVKDQEGSLPEEVTESSTISSLLRQYTASNG